MLAYKLGGVCRRGHKLTKDTLITFYCRNYGGVRHKCGTCDRAKAKAWASSARGKRSRREAKLRYKISHGLNIGRKPASRCTEPGCNRVVQGFGLCAKHYQRWRYATNSEFRERTKQYVRERPLKGAPSEFVALFRKFYQLKKELQQ